VFSQILKLKIVEDTVFAAHIIKFRDLKHEAHLNNIYEFGLYREVAATSLILISEGKAIPVTGRGGPKGL
jgi:hypothetical protein